MSVLAYYLLSENDDSPVHSVVAGAAPQNTDVLRPDEMAPMPEVPMNPYDDCVIIGFWDKSK